MTRELNMAEARAGEITPDTHVRMSLTKVVALIGGIVAIVTGGVASWFGITSLIREVSNRVEVHIKDTNVHLEPDYQKDHGRPVGKWDINAWQTQNTRALENLQLAVDQLRTELVKKRR